MKNQNYKKTLKYRIVEILRGNEEMNLSEISGKLNEKHTVISGVLTAMTYEGVLERTKKDKYGSGLVFYYKIKDAKKYLFADEMTDTNKNSS